MNCEKFSKSLVSYLDGRTNARERDEVEAHLKACVECRERANEFRRLWNVMDGVPAVEPSFGFDARLRQRIAAEPRRRIWAWMLPSPRFAAAVVLLLGLSVFVSLRPNRVQPNATMNSEEQFQMIKDLGVLENYDVLSNFDALSDLPAARSSEQPAQQKTTDPGDGTGESWNRAAMGLKASEGL